MALLMWSEKYSVGVKEMDSQHVTLVNILNELHTAMLKGQAQNVADPLLKNMLEYMQQHLSTEEALMEGAGFPGLAEHCAEHQALRAKVQEYNARFKQGDITMYPELLYFVRDWFVNHMQQMDKKYTAWMNERGIC